MEKICRNKLDKKQKHLRKQKSLSYAAKLNLSGWRDSNPRPPRPERGALPDCATPRISAAKVKNILIKTDNRNKIIDL